MDDLEAHKSLHQQRVEEFMRGARQEVKDRPTLPSKEVRRLRAELILEEALETIEALGFRVTNYDGNFGVAPDNKGNLVKLADGCADLSVVTIGTLSAAGVADQLLFHTVDENNLDKLGPGSSWSPTGKLLKPPGHQPPDIAGVLRAQGWRG